MTDISTIHDDPDPCDKVRSFKVNQGDARISFIRRDDTFKIVSEESSVWERLQIADLSKEEFNQIIIKMTALQHDEVNKE